MECLVNGLSWSHSLNQILKIFVICKLTLCLIYKQILCTCVTRHKLKKQLILKKKRHLSKSRTRLPRCYDKLMSYHSLQKQNKTKHPTTCPGWMAQLFGVSCLTPTGCRYGSGQGTHLAFGFDPWWGAYRRQPIDISLPHFLSL